MASRLYSSPSLPNIRQTGTSTPPTMAPSYITPPLTPSSSIHTSSDNDTPSRAIRLANFTASIESVRASASRTVADELAKCLHKKIVLDELAKIESTTDPSILFIFSDIRHARIAFRCLNADPAENMSCQYSLAQNGDGAFYVSVANVHSHPWSFGSAEINVQTLRHYLTTFGDLASFNYIRDGPENQTKTYRVEYYDVKEAETAFQTLDKRVVFGMNFAVSYRDSETIYSSRQHSQFPAYEGVSRWENEMKHQVSQCATPDRRCDYCPSRGPPVSAPYHIPPTPSPPTLMCSPHIGSPPPMHLMMPPHTQPEYAFQPVYNHPWHDMSARIPHPVPFSSPPPFWVPEDVRPITAPMYPMPPPPIENIIIGHPPHHHPVSHFHSPPSSPPNSQDPRRPSSPAALSEAFHQLSLTGSQPHENGIQVYPPHASSPENATRNQLNIQKIEEGQDMRTTVMIKNIPNKMSDKDLITYIGKVVPRRIDFIYLRIDFKNGANVGYAFVNFITVQDLLMFAKARLGEKWNMFSSEKVLQMSYANYQGKESLVEKFKNSCIMDEQESWRPKIFYSSGPDQGLPEPFPAPTHIRRKERSSFNRGALFVPGVHHQYNRLHNNNHHSSTLNSPLSSNDGSDAGSGPGHNGGHPFGRRGLKKGRQVDVHG